jgi:hypothetical protein
VQLGGVLIWISTGLLIGVFFFAVFASSKDASARVILTVQTGLPRNFEFVPIPDCAKQNYAMRGYPLIKLRPLRVIGNTRVQSKLDNLPLPRLQDSFREADVRALPVIRHFDLPESGGNEIDVALNNPCGRTPSIRYLEGHDAPDCLDEYFVSNFLAETHGPCMTNCDSRAVLQNQRFVLNPRNLLHFFQLGFHVSGLIIHRPQLAPHRDSLKAHLSRLAVHYPRLAAIDNNLSDKGQNLKYSYAHQRPCKVRYFPLNVEVILCCIGLICAFGWVFGCGIWLAFRDDGGLRRSRRGACGWVLAVIGAFGVSCAYSVVGFGSPFAFWQFRWLLGDLENECNNQQFQHNRENVPQNVLTTFTYWSTLSTSRSDMANVLNMDKQIMVIGALAEGSSIRSIERMTGVHRDTIMRLGVRVGQGCTSLMDAKMRNLPCTRLEMDESGDLSARKRSTLRLRMAPKLGSVWTFCAIDAETKLVPAFKCGDRSKATANAFMQDVASRLAYRVQISTDGLNAYVGAIENAFGADVDYAQIIITLKSLRSTESEIIATIGVTARPT